MSENENIQMKVAEPQSQPQEKREHQGQEKSQPQGQTVDVNVTLLKNLNALMEIVISRGVFKPNELSSVGKVYDDLNKLLNT